MDLSITTAALLFTVACVSCVTGKMLPTPENLQVNILDGDVFALWNKAPGDVLYNVEFGHHAGEWEPVKKCTKITQTFCDLSNLIEDYMGTYKVRVQSEADGVQSEWTPKKKFLPNSSDLQPPSFTMWATSSTLTIQIHKKPVLRQIFPFGITYTIYLVEKEQNKSTISYLNDDIWDHPKNKVFRSLHWGKEYCVTIRVEGNTGTTSSMSPQQCVVLPELEWIIIAVASLTVVGILIIAAFISALIFCYVKRPVKTPAALKSPANFWRPLSIREVTMEVVTDKGWFLSSARTEVNDVFLNLPTTCMMDQQKTEEERRPSTDSGVSMKSPSDGRREDSGCSSVGGQDTMCNYPTQHDRSDGKSLDSGLGLKCHSDTSSLILDQEDLDSDCLNKSGKYDQLQTVNIHDCDHGQMFKERLPQQLISVVSGYRKNTSICTCAGANLCIWCHNQEDYTGQSKALLQNNINVESYRHHSPNIQMEETFPMLTSLSSISLMEKGRNFNIKDVSISLCDVELNHQ